MYNYILCKAQCDVRNDQEYSNVIMNSAFQIYFIFTGIVEMCFGNVSLSLPPADAQALSPMLNISFLS